MADVQQLAIESLVRFQKRGVGLGVCRGRDDGSTDSTTKEWPATM